MPQYAILWPTRQYVSGLLGCHWKFHRSISKPPRGFMPITRPKSRSGVQLSRQRASRANDPFRKCERERVLCAMRSAGWHDLTRDDFGNRQIVAVAALAEALHDPGLILRLAILAHLPL